MRAYGHILTAALVAIATTFVATSAFAQAMPPPPEPPPLVEGPADDPTDEPVEEPEDEPGDGQGEPEPLETEPPDYFRFGPDSVQLAEPNWTRRLVRISALGMATYAFLAATPAIALGLDFALYGQEFHDQARTFSMLNATLGVVVATATIWPLGLALDGNGDFWWTSIGALASGGLAVAAMYVYAQDDPDKLLAQSFTPGVMAFVTGIVVYELTSDTSRKYRNATGRRDAWVSFAPSGGGATATVGFAW